MLRLHIAPAVVVALVGAGLGLLSGCGSSEPAPYNDADVTFASEMVTHHEQAVAMVDMTDSRSVDAAFRTLADGIRDAQEPEIKQMTGWLEAWDKPTPAEMASSADGSSDPGGDDAGDDLSDDMSMGGSMAGMMTTEQMKDLADAPDPGFEDLWLQLMIEHHEGALTMAQTEIADGQDAAAVELAEHIRDTQADEITEMKAMLAS